MDALIGGLIFYAAFMAELWWIHRKDKRRYMNKPLNKVKMFTFKDKEDPCTYWSSGSHAVWYGECQCGKKFQIWEVN